MFEDFDDNEPSGEDFYNNLDIEETLVKFNLLATDQSVFFSEEEIEALSYHFFLTNKPSEQMAIIDHGLYLFPNKVDFLVEKASILSLDNEYSKALEIIRKAKSFEPYNALIHKMEGEILTDLEQNDEAEQCFILALEFSEFEEDDFVVEVYVLYARLLSENQQMDKANRLIERALKRFADNEQLFNQLSMNFIANGSYDRAVEYFKSHIDKDPYSHLSWFHLGRFYELTNKQTLALDAYEYSGLANKESKNAFFSMGSLFESKSEYRKAIDNYSECFKNSGDLYPNICIARCYLAMEDGELARVFLKKAKALEDVLPEYSFLLGYSHLTDKQPLKALPLFKKVYKDDKDDFTALKGILTCYSDLDNNSEIENIYKELRKNNNELLVSNWKELASVFYHSEMDEILGELMDEISKKNDLEEELNSVLIVIKFDQEPSDINKEAIISGLIHNFDETIESVKLFCPDLDEDEEFMKLVKIYQNDKDEQ